MALINQTHHVNNTFYPEGYERRHIYENAICAVVLLAIMLEAIIGNVAVIISVFKFNDLRSENSNLFIVNLSITDLFTSMIVMFSSMGILIADYWPFGTIWCDIVCAANYCLIIVSMLTLCFVSVDRYIAMVHPYKYQTRITQSRIIIMILYSWFQGIIFAIGPIICGWIEFDYWEVICAISWYKERPNVLYYVIFAFLMCFLLPGILLAYCYCHVLAIAKAKQRQIQQMTTAVCAMTHSKYSTSSKAVRSLLIVMIAYFVCMTPFSCTKLYKVLVHEHESLPNYVNIMASFMAFFSSAINPLIYGIFRADFQKAYKILWRQITASNSIGVSQG